ncbi:unnamed protein product, partial [Closterium sp. NIES-54]
CASANPPSVGGECALGTDVLKDTKEDFECLAAAVPRFASMLLAPKGDPDAPDIPTPRSYAEAGRQPWMPKWHPGSPQAPTSTSFLHLGRTYQRQGVDYFQSFSPTLKRNTLRVLLHVAAQRDYELHSLDISTAFLQGSLQEEIWLRRPPGFTESFPVLQRFGFLFSSPQPTPLSTNHSLSAPPSNKSVVQSGPYPELVGCLMYMMTCTRPDLVYPLSLLARYVAPGRHGKVHWDAAKRVLRYLCSTLGMGLVLGGRGPLVLTGHADASWVDDSAMQRSSHGYTFSLGSGGGQQRQQCLLETLSLQQHREWAVRWGSPGGGAGGTSAGGVEAPSGVYFASLGACDSVCTGAELEEALHTFLLYSGAYCCFFRD